ncbi:MAG TPA: 2-dehydro-3-deoxygalactonokinase [Caulobacteraceae bacterium]|jgi:2-dehydro-3-deoxygalactonokinase|nr:2-dehydro-3-deoxygalactonokinase [Caulobacteraceae bacterium]
MGALLACDWGTTNLRAWVLGVNGAVEAKREFALGVAKLAPGEAEQRFKDEVRPALNAQDLPAVLCGMIGSALGWTAVPYVDCPASLSDLAAGLYRADDRSRIVPGLRGPGLEDGGFDVMRGEETQLFGWLARDSARAQGRHIVCHPGTHAKWALVEDGRVVRFLTAMTGELFDVLSRHGVLKSDAPADDAQAFLKGVEAAADGGELSARLFTVRTRVVASGLPARSATSYLSGLLIGSEIASLPRLLGVGEDETIALLGDDRLCGWYAMALTHKGRRSESFDGDEAALAGLRALAQGGGL